VHGDVEGVRVVQQPDFGAFGGGLAVGRLLLGERFDGRRRAPGGLVEQAVDIRGLSRPAGLHLKLVPAGAVLVLLRP
jgi:hypothetical protein